MAENKTNKPQENEEKKKKHNKFVAWWLGLRKGTRIVICTVLSAGVASAITFPILANTIWKKSPDSPVSEVAEKLEFNKTGQYTYTCTTNKLVKGKKYTFSVKVTELDTLDDGLYLEIIDKASGTAVFRAADFIKNETFKADDKKMNKIADYSADVGQYEYCYNSHGTGTILNLGDKTFTDPPLETMLNAEFTSGESSEKLTILLTTE